MTRSPSPLARFFAPLFGVFGPLLIACSVIMGVVWVTGFGDATLADPTFARLVPNRELRAALAAMAHGIDATWLVLASIVIYLALVQGEGISVARRWSLSVIAAAFLLPTISTITGRPLGPVFYPENLGSKIGSIPFALPLLWLVVILGARETTWRFLPRASHGRIAVITGLLVLLTTFNLDTLAWKYRAWWLWYPGPGVHPSNTPPQNFLWWTLGAVALAWTMRTPHVVPLQPKRSIAPVAAFAFLNTLALLTHAALRWR